MTRVAAIDCGTNSVRLLIADVTGGGLTDVERRLEIVRLGQGVDRTGRLAPEALERTFGAMRGYAKLIKEHGASPVRVVATSATRDAANRADFVTGVREIFGVEPEVVTGAEEARLSFVGATAGLSGVEPPVLVFDIGGGSTEFVLGSETVENVLSVDIGCVRLTERHLASGVTPQAVAAAGADIDAALDRVAAEVPVERARTVIGLAGTVTTIAGIALDAPAYDPERNHGARIEAARVHEISRRLLAMSHDERAAIPVMHPGRVDVIGAGGLILDRILARFGFPEVLVSEHDILDGLAYSLDESSSG
ncbi:hydrolase [Sphaerisporangium siamense]|uniref:Exopolyphosphatase/guanosine-5'-triphosphate, 3'-diphosphate pyrophosphatase n=1 Tax=Sphaerisporangium siamense TaxID=795645 RepID=A0A7W7D8A5_9ACTN|nr:Ppx/GppA phosphatase family protein [Sphaerisporangium siamense]MBB4700776.1 exopolyphosphatase/guanosine-5'-triphosphate,3'-diphosphate pyrophosphatase [Sphaerisporangium siamense]GII88828.1 hydrolase [Sphaerisporangium siamense]